MDLLTKKFCIYPFLQKIVDLVSFVSSICPYPQFRELFNPKPDITVSFPLQKTGVMYKIFTFTHYTCFFVTIQNLFYFVDSFNTTS